MTDPNMKPGYKTSEFWLALAASVPGILVMAGLVPVGDEPNLETLVSKIGAGVLASIAVWRYIASRQAAKNGGS